MRTFLSIIVLLTSLSASAQVPADSVGLFAIKDNKTVRMDKIDFQSIKGTGGLASAFSFGIAKIKSKMEFKGATSPHHFKGTARFRMYFGNPPASEYVNLYQFLPSNSPKSFEVAKFQVKKKTRRLTGVSASIFGSTAGVEADNDIKVSAKELSPNVYEVEVSGEPGEYCFIYVAHNTNGFGGAYDFTLE